MHEARNDSSQTNLADNSAQLQNNSSLVSAFFPHDVDTFTVFLFFMETSRKAGPSTLALREKLQTATTSVNKFQEDLFSISFQ